MKKLLICLLVGILFISMVSASSYTFKQNSDNIIDIPVYDENYAPLASCNANLSITDPSGSKVLNQGAMNCVNGHSTYNITSVQTATIGSGYSGEVAFSYNGKSGFVTFGYDVTASGLSNLLGFYILIVVVIYAIGFVGFFGKNEWVTILGGMAMLGLGIFTINNGIDIFRNQITDIFSWTTIGIGAFFVLYAGISVIQETYN